jgi:hypothetical protein
MSPAPNSDRDAMFATSAAPTDVLTTASRPERTLRHGVFGGVIKG